MRPLLRLSPVTAINTNSASNSASTTANTASNSATSDAFNVTSGVNSTVQADLNGTYTSSSVLSGVLKLTKEDATVDTLELDAHANFSSNLLCHYDGTVTSNSTIYTAGTFSTGSVLNTGSVSSGTDSGFGPYFIMGSTASNPHWNIPGSFGDSISNKATFSFLSLSHF